MSDELRAAYARETGKNSYRFVTEGSASGFTAEYVHWLEDKAAAHFAEPDEQLITVDGTAVEEALRQLARLTAALHKAKAHPDYVYQTVPTVPANGHIDMARAGFEPCQEAAVTLGDEVWRRKRE